MKCGVLIHMFKIMLKLYQKHAVLKVPCTQKVTFIDSTHMHFHSIFSTHVKHMVLNAVVLVVDKVYKI